MRSNVLVRIASRLLLFAALVQLPPLLVALIARERDWYAYAVPGAVLAALAALLSRLKAARAAPLDHLRRKEGLFFVTAGWLVIVLATAVAYSLTGIFPGFPQAFFESMSGYTTTGATIFADIEALPPSVVFMRAFSHWVGGMGIIVLSVAILPELAIGGMQLFSAEASGIESDKLAPRIRETARRLWVLYVGMTALELVLLMAGGLSFFDALLHSFATVATGGFSNYTASVSAFGSVYVEIVIMTFMFAAGISFALLYRAILGRAPQKLWQSAEVRLYALLTLAAMTVITLNLLEHGHYKSFAETLRYAAFQTISIITTTGFGTADFDAWPHLSRLVLLCLMIVGGCAGSTAGGIKVVRLYVVARHALVQLRRIVRPRVVQTIQLGRRDVSRATIEGILGFLILYSVALVAGGLGMTFLGMDLVSGFTAAVSALNSIGPGLGTVGAAQNFGHVHPAGMYLLSFGMLLGRLEIYTVLVLLTPYFWRRG